jgi:hypothetical protein
VRGSTNGAMMCTDGTVVGTVVVRIEVGCRT